MIVISPQVSPVTPGPLVAVCAQCWYKTCTGAGGWSVVSSVVTAGLSTLRCDAILGLGNVVTSPRYLTFLTRSSTQDNGGGDIPAMRGMRILSDNKQTENIIRD